MILPTTVLLFSRNKHKRIKLIWDKREIRILRFSYDPFCIDKPICYWLFKSKSRAYCSLIYLVQPLINSDSEIARALSTSSFLLNTSKSFNLALPYRLSIYITIVPDKPYLFFPVQKAFKCRGVIPSEISFFTSEILAESHCPEA